MADGGADEDETRSIVTELDYSKKDATRHIVAAKNGGDTLRQKLLRNLESVKKNKPLLKSEVGSYLSATQSRYSKMSARTSQAPNKNDGRLARIEEGEDGEAATLCCEACAKFIVNEDDLAMNEEISKQAAEEANIKKAYAEFRNVRGMAPVDWKVTPDH